MEDPQPLINDIRSFLLRERTGMTEHYGTDIHRDVSNPNSPLHDFSRAFKGVPDGLPKEYAQACMSYERKQQKDDSTGSLDGTVAYQWSSSGSLTLIGPGRAHIELSRAAQDQLQALLSNRPVPAAQPVPPPPMLASMQQNELALKAIKERNR